MKKYRILVVGYCIILGVALLFIYLGDHTVMTIAENINETASQTIVIDPGHGGIDGGAISCTGIPESRFNLEISMRLRDLFRLLGYKTRMIRESDISIYKEGNTIASRKMSDLKERVRIVNETENALLLSIHQNTFPESRFSGPQIFYTNREESKILAQKLQNSLTDHLKPENRRQAKKCSNVYLMENIQCTGVLIECGFLSNPEEEAKLKTDVYQKKLSAVIACTVIEYLANT